MCKLLSEINKINDPRQDSKIKYNLTNIIFISICTIFYSAETWKDINVFAVSKREWLSRYLDLSGGIPSSDTFRRVFGLIVPSEIGVFTQSAIEKLIQKKSGEHIAIDGKTVRGNRCVAKGIKPIQIVSAWSETHGVSLAEVTVDNKSNEITAIPALLDLLDIKDTTISIDAMGTQKSIAQKIINKEAHYMLALKVNHGKSHTQIKNHMVSTGTKPSNLIYDQFDDSHGRSIRRRYFTESIPDSIGNNGFANCKTIIATETISRINGSDKVTAEWRYYISDHEKDNDKIPGYIRGHWGVENKLHWVLDVHLNDDSDKKLDANAADNISRIKRLLLNLIRKNDPYSKLSVGRRLKKLLWDEDYFFKIIGI